MHDAPALQVLAGGFPPEPDAADWNQIASFPGPRSLLEAAFLEFCGVSLNDMPQHEDADAGSVDGDWQVRHLVVGRDDVGYRLVERKCTQTSALPLKLAVETFGLPGLDLRWAYRLNFAGQLGHCVFEHDRLTARFETGEVKIRFENVWRRVFDRAAVFETA